MMYRKNTEPVKYFTIEEKSRETLRDADIHRKMGDHDEMGLFFVNLTIRMPVSYEILT